MTALRPVRVFFPDWSARRIADACRAKRIPGAVKVGREWMLRESDFDAWVAGTRMPVAVAPPSIEDAIAILRSKGVAA